MRGLKTLLILAALTQRQKFQCPFAFLDDYVITVTHLLSREAPGFTMAIGTPSGWPLGLGNINIRLRVAQNSQMAEPAAAPYSIEMPSPSFSSFSSSNLDTESTASFFQDQSVSLGRLIGLRPGNRGSLHYPNTIQRSLSNRRTQSEVSRNDGAEETSQGICVPLLHNVIEKMSRSKKQLKTLILRPKF